MKFGMQVLRKGMRLQSAMEYLTTYGWALALIAVVMGALFSLGIFNANTFAVRTPGGACQVVRNVEGVNLEGQCTNAPPKFVPQLSGAGYINIAQNTRLDTGSAYTVSAWIKTSGGIDMVWSAWSGGAGGYQLYVNGGNLQAWTGSGSIAGGAVNDNKWHNVVEALSPGSGSLYVDGALVQSGSVGSFASAGSDQIGVQCSSSCTSILCGSCSPWFYTGLISNIQVYNTTLSAADVKTLYTEGVGGLPVYITRIVGWWPLNGDTNDYSGYTQTGQIVGSMSYTSAWT